MEESEFSLWALSMGIDGTTLSVLTTPPTRFAERELIQRFIPCFESIRQLNYEEPLGTSAVKSGFIVIGDCPDGDPIAVDLKTNPGSVHYICHEDLDDDGGVISKMVAPDIQTFATMMNDETVPYDYHSATIWTSENNAG